MDIETLIRAKLSGELSETPIYINLTLQAVAVMIGGILIWRASNAYHAKKQRERANRTYFESRYSKTWRK
jgi:hypothetical protein